jgi:hypothetical protein
MSSKATTPVPNRSIPSNPVVKRLKASFNGETITVNYLLLDARSNDEKESDKTCGNLKGCPIVFFQGHDQRPGDCYGFTTRLALNGKSGICIVPTCDTPYGDDPAWRGDRGKMAILMAVVRHLLDSCSVSVEDYRPITGIEVLVNGMPVAANQNDAKTKICSVGWSHGGILAREFASNYPESVIGLATVCSAGYRKWRNPGELLMRFGLEALNSGVSAIACRTPGAIGSGWGLVCGFAGDASRSVSDGFSSGRPAKLARPYKDILDCTRFIDERAAPVSNLNNITVIFSRNDTCMAVKDYGISNLDLPSEHDIEAFWKTYYPSNLARHAKLTFKILPGTHAAPATHSSLYAETVLAGLSLKAEGRIPADEE